MHSNDCKIFCACTTPLKALTRTLQICMSISLRFVWLTVSVWHRIFSLQPRFTVTHFMPNEQRRKCEPTTTTTIYTQQPNTEQYNDNNKRWRRGRRRRCWRSAKRYSSRQCSCTHFAYTEKERRGEYTQKRAAPTNVHTHTVLSRTGWIVVGFFVLLFVSHQYVLVWLLYRLSFGLLLFSFPLFLSPSPSFLVRCFFRSGFFRGFFLRFSVFGFLVDYFKFYFASFSALLGRKTTRNF